MDPNKKNIESNSEESSGNNSDPDKNATGHQKNEGEKTEPKSKITIEKGKWPIDFDDLFF